MSGSSFPTSGRYIFQTQGVCPPEIHFRIQDRRLEQLRFVGGGCPGNARLVERLLLGRLLEDVLEQVAGIDCRNGTSCPDQLATALRLAMNGGLKPSESFRISEEDGIRNRVGVIGDLGGKVFPLERILENMAAAKVEAVYCLGNLTGNGRENRKVLQRIRESGIHAILGERDWRILANETVDSYGFPQTSDRDRLLRVPQMRIFQVGIYRTVAFYGDYLQHLNGFSDYDPYALEMNMVCGLADFMRDETVFPALAAMTPQFQADIILFGQTDQWGRWEVEGKTFIAVGPAVSGDHVTWGILEARGTEIHFNRQLSDRESAAD